VARIELRKDRDLGGFVWVFEMSYSDDLGPVCVCTKRGFITEEQARGWLLPRLAMLDKSPVFLYKDREDR